MGINKVIFHFFLLFLCLFTLVPSIGFLKSYYEYDKNGEATIIEKKMIKVSDGEILSLTLELKNDNFRNKLTVTESSIDYLKFKIGQKYEVMYKYNIADDNIIGIIKPESNIILLNYVALIFALIICIKCVHFFITNWKKSIELISTMDVVKD